MYRADNPLGSTIGIVFFQRNWDFQRKLAKVIKMMTNVVKSRRLIIFLAVLGVSALIVVNVTHTGLGYMKLQNPGTFYNGSSTESSATPGYNQLSFFEPFKKMTQKPRRKTVPSNIKYHGIDLLSLVRHTTEAFPCEVGKFRKNHDMRFRYLSHLYESLISWHQVGLDVLIV